MSLNYSPEVLRQHAAHKEIRARLNTMPAVPMRNIEPKHNYPLLKIAPVDEPAKSLSQKWFEEMHAAIDEPMSRGPSIGAICIEVRNQFGVGKMDFESPRRHKDIITARYVAMGLARRLTLMSFPEIGRRMGGRDHTTILHGCRRIQPVIDAVAARIAHDASISDWVAAMKDEVQVTQCTRYGYMQNRKPIGQEQ